MVLVFDSSHGRTRLPVYEFHRESDSRLERCTQWHDNPLAPPSMRHSNTSATFASHYRKIDRSAVSSAFTVWIDLIDWLLNPEGSQIHPSVSRCTLLFALPALPMSDKSCGAVILLFSVSLFVYYTFWVILSVTSPYQPPLHCAALSDAPLRPSSWTAVH